MSRSSRRRIALLFVPLALALWLWVPSAPSEHALHLRLGTPAVSTVDLRFQQDDSVKRSVTLSFPEGASGAVTRSVRLAKGDYQVGAHVVRADGSEYGTTQWRHVDGEDDVVDLDLTK